MTPAEKIAGAQKKFNEDLEKSITDLCQEFTTTTGCNIIVRGITRNDVAHEMDEFGMISSYAIFVTSQVVLPGNLTEQST